jgi:hypothetical protein
VSHAGPFHRCASPSCRFARWVLLPAAALGFALTASLAFAQTPPVQVGPTVAVTFHAGFNYSCAGVELEQWGMVYGERCNAEPPVVLVPFIATVLVRLTPLTNPPTPLAVDPTRPVVIRTVARGSVSRCRGVCADACAVLVGACSEPDGLPGHRRGARGCVWCSE